MSAVGWPVWSLATISRAIGEIDGLAAGRNKRELRLVLDGVHGVQRDSLEICAVVAGGLDAGERKLRGDVLGGQLASARAGSAAFEQIEREKAHMRANLFGIDRRRRGARGRRQAGNLRNGIGGGLLRNCNQRQRQPAITRQERNLLCMNSPKSKRIRGRACNWPQASKSSGYFGMAGCAQTRRAAADRHA